MHRNVLPGSVSHLLILFFVLGALLWVAAASGVATLAIPTSTQSIQTLQEQFHPDVSTLILPDGIHASKRSQPAEGNACWTAVEATHKHPEVGNLHLEDNWVYTATITETSDDAWESGSLYRLDFFADGAVRAVLYFRNDNASSKIEGVTAAVDLGTSGSLPETFTIVTTKITTC